MVLLVTFDRPPTPYLFFYNSHVGPFDMLQLVSEINSLIPFVNGITTFVLLI